MSPEAHTRIFKAVEHAPDRRCVTLRREDARDILAENATARILATEASSKLCEMREEREDLKAALMATTVSLNEATDDVAQLSAQRFADATRSVTAQGRPTWPEMIAGVFLGLAVGWLIPAMHLLPFYHG